MVIRTIKIFWILSVFLSCDSKPKNQASPEKLATSADLPPGQLAEPGPDSGIYLGHYNTCQEYANYVMKALAGSALFGQLLNPDIPVKCKKAHTCHCMGGKYFIEDFRGAKAPVYRCVEPADTGIEAPEVYQGHSGQGVIKFASPQSVCSPL